MKKTIATLLLSIVISLYSCKHKEYYDNGVLKTIGTLKNNKKIGKWKYYSNEGLLYLEENYKNDIRDGQRRQYYKSGNIMLEGAIKKNRLIGKWKEYYKNGQLKSEGLYGDKIEKETWILFSENSPMTFIFLKEEKRLFQYYDKLDFLKRIPFEKETLWNENEEKLFKIPNKEGSWIYYFENGEVKSEEIYHDNNEIMECNYYENGQLKKIADTYYTGAYDWEGEYMMVEISEEYFRESYSETGQPTYYVNNVGDIIKATYKNGQIESKNIYFKNGNWLDEHYKNGQIESKNTYFKNGKSVKEYYKNGQLQKRITNHSKKNDSKKEVYKNGKLETVHIYTGEDRRLKVYDKLGKLISNEYIPINCTNFIGVRFN